MFITFEGIDGSGKTSVIKEVEKILKQKNKKVLVTREPGGTEIAEQIRELILNNEMDSLTEAFLFAANRREHVLKKIKPALKEYDFILCDRYIDSSLSYQGFARDLGIEKIKEINKYAIDGCLPDKTFIFNIDIDTAIQRIVKNKNREVNRLDLEEKSFYEKIKKGYEIISKEKKRYIWIDANKSIKKIAKEIIKEII